MTLQQQLQSNKETIDKLLEDIKEYNYQPYLRQHLTFAKIELERQLKNIQNSV